MKTIKGANLDAEARIFSGGTALTIGNFDGVHVGHKAILRRLKQRADSLIVPSVVVTFDPHPRKVLSPPGSLRLLVDCDTKMKLIAEMNVDAIVPIEFTVDFAAQKPVEFVENWLMKMKPKAVVIGYDFNFGRGGSAGIDFIKEEGRARGFDVDVVEAMTVDGVVASSSRIRNLVEAGEVSFAAKLLGRPYSVSGTVVHGHRRGRTIGFPTANLGTKAEVIPGDGVYAGEVDVQGETHAAMVNVGKNPTFNDETRSVEACILNFNRDIYEEKITVRFLERIRNEIKFAGVDELIACIKHDQSVIEEYFKDRPAESGGDGKK